VAGVAATVVAAVAVPSAAGAATASRSAMGGQAFGSTVRLGSLVRSGKTAYVPLCTTKLGVAHRDRTAAVSLPGVGRIGAVKTAMTTARTATGPRTTATSHTATTRLFGGAIRATALATRATAVRTAKGVRLVGGTTVVGLTVAGKPISNPTPNQSIALPGIGTAYLNQQTRSRRFGDPRIAVTALRVVVASKNSAGLPPGAIAIGTSVATLHQPTRHRATGAAWGTTVRVGNEVKSGRTAPVYLPCGGSNGKTLTRNATASIVLPKAVRTSDVATHGTSSDTAKRTVATTRSHIGRVNLLGGAIRVRGINARATATRLANGRLVRSSSSSGVVAVQVNGKGMPVSNKPNTHYSLPGLGTMWLHRVIRTPNGLRVFALQLVLGRNINGLQKGAVITAGAAQAAVVRS
jgi:hypothetical protein